MKKILLLALVSILLAACGNVAHSGGLTKIGNVTKFETVNNLDRVTMTVKEDSISPTEVTVVLENNTDKGVMYGESYWLEKKMEDNWYEVTTRLTDYGFNDVAFHLGSSESTEITITIGHIYDSLQPGEYRIVKDGSVEVGWEYDDYHLAAQFTIE